MRRRRIMGPGDRINRRTFLCGLTLSALASPLGSEAQQAGKYRIGYLSIAAEEHITHLLKNLEMWTRSSKALHLRPCLWSSRPSSS